MVGSERSAVTDMLVHPRNWIVCVWLAALAALSSCNVIEGVGGMAAQAGGTYVAPEYTGLAHERVAILVWTEPGVRSDFPYLQLDVASGLQEKFKIIESTDKPKELEQARFPLRADSIARYQEDHPEIDTMPITDTAARFNVDRLIYIEISDFATRSDASLDLYKGSVTGSLKVLEIQDGKAQVVYTEDEIKTVFPKDSPKEGMPEGSDAKIYQGTLDAFTTDVTNRFYRHVEEDTGGANPGSM